MANGKSIYRIIADNENFSVLLKVLDNTEIGKAIQNQRQPFTFFAPTDGAFFRMFQDNSLYERSDCKILAASILDRHLVPGAFLFSDDLRQRSSVITLDGTRMEIRDAGNCLYLEDAQILTPGTAAIDGVVFAVDKVLLNSENGVEW